MIPTPDLSHLRKEDYECVYEPAEDTFILLDALERDADCLKSMRPTVCLEIGSGTGCVSSFVSKILGPTNAHCTLRTGRQNGVELQPLLTSLSGPLSARLRNRVDLLLFNPPYVPTVVNELESAQGSKGLAGSWAGGVDGMQLTNKFLNFVEHLLSPQGKFYLVALKANGVENIRTRMLQDFGLESEICLQRRAGREQLFVLRFQKK